MKKWAMAAVLCAALGVIAAPLQADDEDLKRFELMLKQKDPGKLVEMLGKFIEIGPDGRTAEVSDTTVESMRIRGQTISSRTREHFSVAWRGGRPVITGLTGHVQM